MLGQVRTWASVSGAALLFSAVASAQGPGSWSDGFETSDGHPAGSGAGVVFTPGGVGTGGWSQWGGSPVNDSLLYNCSGPIASHGGTQYMGTQMLSDTVRPWTGYAAGSGHFDFHVWTYVPQATGTPMAGVQWLVMLNQYVSGGPYNWATQCKFDPLTGYFIAENGTSLITGIPQYGVSTPLTFDAWKECICTVDTTNDIATILYDGVQVGDPFTWSTGPFGGNISTGLQELGCPDLFASSAGTLAGSFMFWDDLSIVAHNAPALVDPPGCISAPVAYCTAGTSSNGCVPVISGSAQPSVTQATACNITVTSVEGQKNGLIFYGITGTAASPWGPGSTSFLCVKAPTQRTGTQSSGGTAGACNGTMSLNWNAYQTANPLSLGNPWAVGNHVYVQSWYRDPPAVKTTNLSGAIDMTYVP